MWKRLFYWRTSKLAIAFRDLSSIRRATVLQVRTKEVAALRQAGQANPTANQWWLDYIGSRGVKPHN